MLRYVILRTHGGLGNQLFQVLVGRLLAESRRIQLREVHDLRYAHAFPRCQELKFGDSPSKLQTFISAARIPKILQRIAGRDESPWKFGESIYLDGYFQDKSSFIEFKPSAIARHLQDFRNELSIKQAKIDARLVHLRVGDFFDNEDTAVEHVLARLEDARAGFHVMTNNEKLLQHFKIQELIRAKEAHLVTTKNMSAVDVLRTMSHYRHIDANDSTLTFWASVLAGCQVSFKSKILQACCDFLSSRS